MLHQILTMKSFKSFALALLCLSAVLLQAEEKEPTAFDLIQEGNRYVGEQAKDRVVQVRSEKSIGSLAPRVWFVVYHDPTATFKAVEVKFAAGKMVDVKRPFRVLERVASKTRAMPKKSLKIDSDEAIQIALKEPILEGITPKAVSAKLEDSDLGPVWIIRIWAEKLQKPSENVDIGEVTLTADEGKVVRNELEIGRVD